MLKVKAFYVSLPEGGYRSFQDHDTFAAYLKVFQASGFDITWSDSHTAHVCNPS
jgi:hypothetical protein